MKDKDTRTSVIKFLNMFMPETLAKRLVCIILLAVGVPNEAVEDAKARLPM